MLVLYICRSLNTHIPSAPPGPRTSSLLRSLPPPPFRLFPQGSWISGEWWKRVPGIDVHTCTDAELKQATQGYISTAPSTQTVSLATLPGATGGIAAEWRLRYQARAEAMGVQTSDYGATAYDGIVRFLHHNPHICSSHPKPLHRTMLSPTCTSLLNAWSQCFASHAWSQVLPPMLGFKRVCSRTPLARSAASLRALARRIRFTRSPGYVLLTRFARSGPGL